ncbi:hypothetical protein F4560_001749 [Saccharothrix ecbatanensis]|uniref:Uncharacterized protein n=1 Tax=Saccharothrix ecbatanensis TaxID=1105145 RepID=A0A7W9HHD6_9PSEU|nr:hypothetical protein [Saccharothrix ecbatanensis]MBB5801981.1 hypothetical protein [Saccharothrix ecbatanensis]
MATMLPDEMLDEEPFTGVVVFMPWNEEVNVGRDAFDRLLARYFRCVEQAARTRNDPALAESWWPGFVATVDVLARRAEG